MAEFWGDMPGKQRVSEKEIRGVKSPVNPLEGTFEIPGAITPAADSSIETLQVPSRPRHHKLVNDFLQVVFLLFQFALDAGMVTLGFVAAYLVRSKVPFGGTFIPYSPHNYSIILPISVASVMVCFYYRKLYNLKRGYSRIDEFYRICAATAIGLVLAIALNSVIIGPSFQYSRQILIYGLVFIIFYDAAARLIFGALVNWLRTRGVTQVRLVLVGTGEATQRILRKVNEAPELGYRIVGVLIDESEDEPLPGFKFPVLGHARNLREVVRQHEVDEVIVTASGATPTSLLELIDRCDGLPVSIKLYPDTFQLITANDVAIGDLTGLPMVSLKDVSLRGVNRVVKRLMDVAISALILVVVSPIMIVSAILIKLTDPHGPVFFTQPRVGLDGRPFTVLKFRSMRSDSEANGPGWTTANDPRRTRLGRFLRRYSLDELPQFINVLLGDMSIVGPRPEQVHMVEEFSRKYPRYMRRHKEKAGITGWAQVNGMRGDTSIEERIRYDLYYVENWSVLFDLKIILKTIIVVFTDKNAY